MSSLFTGIHAKLDRSHETLMAVAAEIAHFFEEEAKPWRIDLRSEEGGLRFVWRAHEVRPPPARFSVMAGEIVHGLRSSLDHMVCAMVLARGNTIGAWHKFPVHYDSAKFFEAVKSRALDGISAPARSWIESLQPFADLQRNAIVGALHDYDVINKHRLLPLAQSVLAFDNVALHLEGQDPTVAEGEEVTLASTIEVRPMRRLTPEGEDILSLALGRVHLNLRPEAQFAHFLAFEKIGLFEMQPMLPTLAAALDHVRAIITEAESNHT
jgi:hypothetical protein